MRRAPTWISLTCSICSPKKLSKHNTCLTQFGCLSEHKLHSALLCFLEPSYCTVVPSLA